MQDDWFTLFLGHDFSHAAQPLSASQVRLSFGTEETQLRFSTVWVCVDGNFDGRTNQGVLNMLQPPADGCPREFPAAALGCTALWPEVTLSRSFIGSALSRYAALADVGPQTQKQAMESI
jgi:hypothetical protein